MVLVAGCPATDGPDSPKADAGPDSATAPEDIAAAGPDDATDADVTTDELTPDIAGADDDAAPSTDATVDDGTEDAGADPEDVVTADTPATDMGEVPDAGPAADTGAQDTATATDTATADAGTPIEPVVDACVSAADELAISSEVFYSALQTCPVACADKADFAACATDCYATSGAVTTDCGGCYAEVAQCAATTGCAAPCIVNPAGQDCHTCLTSVGCLKPFQQCSGRAVLIGQGPSPEGCVGGVDTAIHKAEDVSGAAFQCALQCQTADEAMDVCSAQCLTSTVGLTSACADCYGASMACVITWCVVPCETDPTSPTCAGCMIEGGCVWAFEQCAAIDFTAPESAP